MKNPTLFVSNVCIGVALATGLFNWKRLDVTFKILVVQLALALAAQLIGIVYKDYYPSNTVVFNIYLFLDLWLVGLLGLRMVTGVMFKTILVVFLLACTLIDILCIQIMGINTFANWGYLSSNILFTVTFLFIFVKMLFDNESSLLIKNPQFWLCVGMLIYYGCTVPLFGFLNYLIKYHASIAAKTYYINDLLTTVRCCFMCVAIVLLRRNKRDNVITKPAAL